MDKENVVYTKKEANLATWDRQDIDGPWRFYAKWNKSDKKGKYWWSHIYVTCKKTNKQSHRFIKQTDSCQWPGLGKMDEDDQKVYIHLKNK